MAQKKIGVFYGVLVPNITMMLGVILFLRLGVIAGHTDIVTMLGVIFVSLAFMLVTSLSIASIATNMRMGSGGVYYLITRSLGVEIGGAVGFAIYLNLLMGIVLTTSGFAYTLCNVFPSLSLFWTEVVTICFLCLLSSVSSKLALKFQVVILAVLLTGVLSVFFGSMEGVEIGSDLTPLYGTDHLSFWQVFALFYPALTGIEAGMAMSGILRRPGRSLFIGNIGGLLFVAFLYSALAILGYITIPIQYLASDPFIFVKYAWSGELVTMGILTATISSSLGCLLGAPRILESMAKDGLAPAILAKTYGKLDEPRWGLWFTGFTALALMVFTRIDQIIPILTMICLITYGLLNLVAGLAELMNTASWRPVVRTPWWLSILGFVVALMMMLFVNVSWTFAAIGFFLILYRIIQGKNLEAGFQDLRESMVFFFSRAALYHLGSPAEHAMVWHPQVLTLSTAITQNRKLAHLANSLTYRSGILTYAAIVPDTWSDAEQITSSRTTMESYIEKEGLAGLIEIQPAESQQQGLINMVKAYGIGPIQPNTILLSVDYEDLDIPALFETVCTCQLMLKNLVLFRDSENTDEKMYTDFDSAEDKKVDLWWAGDDRQGFDLALSLLTTLSDGRKWGGAKFTLNAFAPSRSAKKLLEKYLKDLITQCRLPFEKKVHIDPGSQDYLSYIAKHPSDADLTCFCLRAYEEEESVEEYSEYLESMLMATKAQKDCLFVSNYDQVEHCENYQLLR